MFVSPAIADLRREAASLPGPLPVALNGVSVCESVRPRRLVVRGGDERPTRMPRTVFQLVYPDTAIMLDTGLDRETHETFAGGRPEPYSEDAFAQVLAAMMEAERIVLTHYHADHVGGLITSPDFTALAGRTIVTRATVERIRRTPHRPALQVGEDAVARFPWFDYRGYTAVAPGLVLIEAAGHTSDSQMAYIRLASGQEFLHCVDSAWHMDNIRLLAGKNAPWVKEDDVAVEVQLRWLNELQDHEPIEIVISHDGERLDELHASGLVGPRLQV
jgi:glyoxylase-like metal-dependent hydrolase (beta-lactamase superfamily II)